MLLTDDDLAGESTYNEALPWVAHDLESRGITEAEQPKNLGGAPQRQGRVVARVGSAGRHAPSIGLGTLADLATQGRTFP